MSAETDFWKSFVYDSGADRWDLAPGREPIGVLVTCLAKIQADREAVRAAVGLPPGHAADAVRIAAMLVEVVLNTLDARGGFDGWWDDIYPDVQADIKQELGARIAGLLIATSTADA